MVTTLPAGPAAVASQTAIRRPPWGVLASIAFVIIGYVIRGPLLQWPPLHALLEQSHRNFLWYSIFELAVGTASFMVVALAVWIRRWPLFDYLNFARPRLAHIALGVGAVLIWYLLQHGYYHLVYGKAFGLAAYRAALLAGSTPLWFLLQKWPSIILAPIVEESAYRGFLWRGVEWRLGRAAAMLASVIVFTAAHFPNFIDLRQGTIYFNPLLVYAVMAVMLGWLRWRTGNIAVTMIAHGFSNLLAIVAPMLIVAVAG
jgi:membrane protease YdiL (CAAX protease family)